MKSNFKFKSVAIIIYLALILNFNVLIAKGMEFSSKNSEINTYNHDECEMKEELKKEKDNKLEGEAKLEELRKFENKKFEMNIDFKNIRVDKLKKEIKSVVFDETAEGENILKDILFNCSSEDLLKFYVRLYNRLVESETISPKFSPYFMLFSTENIKNIAVKEVDLSVVFEFDIENIIKQIKKVEKKRIMPNFNVINEILSNFNKHSYDYCVSYIKGIISLYFELVRRKKEENIDKDEISTSGYLELYEGNEVRDFDVFKGDFDAYFKIFLRFENNLRFFEEKFSFINSSEKPLEQLKEYIEKSFKHYMGASRKYGLFYFMGSNDVSKYYSYINFFVDNFVVEVDKRGFCKLKINKPQNDDEVLFKKIKNVIHKCFFKEHLNWCDLKYDERGIYEIFLYVRTFIKFFNDSVYDEKKSKFIHRVYDDFLKFKKSGYNVYFDIERYVSDDKYKKIKVDDYKYKKIRLHFEKDENLNAYDKEDEKIKADHKEDEKIKADHKEDEKIKADGEKKLDIENEILKSVAVYDYRFKHILKEFNYFDSFERYVDFANKYFKYDLPKDIEIRKDAEFMKKFNLYNGYGHYHDTAMHLKDELSDDVAQFVDMNVFLLFYFNRYLDYVIGYALIPKKLRTDELLKSFLEDYTPSVKKPKFSPLALPFYMNEYLRDFEFSSTSMYEYGFEFTEDSYIEGLERDKAMYEYICEIGRRKRAMSEYRCKKDKINKKRIELIRKYINNYKNMNDIYCYLKKAKEALVRSCFFENDHGVYKVKFILPVFNKDIKFKIEEDGCIKIMGKKIDLYQLTEKLSNWNVKNYIYEFSKLFELYNNNSRHYKRTPDGSFDFLTQKEKFMYEFFLFVLAYVKAFNDASHNEKYKSFVEIPCEFFGLRFNWNLKSYSAMKYMKNLIRLQKRIVENYKKTLDKLYEKNGDNSFDFMLNKPLNLKVNDEIKEYHEIYSLAKEEEFKGLFDKNIKLLINNEFTELKDYLKFVKYYIDRIKKNLSQTYLQSLCEKKSYIGGDMDVENLNEEEDVGVKNFNKGKRIQDLSMEDFLINSFYKYLTYVINFLLAPVGFENKRFMSFYLDKKIKEAGNIEKDEEKILDIKKYSEDLYRKFLTKLKYNRYFLLDIRNAFVRNCVLRRNKDGLFDKISVDQDELLKDLENIVHTYNNTGELDLSKLEHKDRLAYRFFLFVRAYIKLLNYSFAKYKYPLPYLDYSEAIYYMNINVLKYLYLIRNYKKNYLLKIKDWLRGKETKNNEAEEILKK